MKEHDEIMTVDEVAEYLKIDKLLVSKLREHGALPFFKTDQQYHIKKSDIDALKEKLDKWNHFFELGNLDYPSDGGITYEELNPGYYDDPENEGKNAGEFDRLYRDMMKLRKLENFFFKSP